MAGLIPESTKFSDKQIEYNIEETSEIKPASWETEGADSNPLKSEGDVTEKDKFLLGRNLIFWVLGCYIIIGGTHCMYGYVKGVEIVWQNSSVFFQSVLTLLVGYYFGTKQTS
jgi:hypothetical protein